MGKKDMKHYLSYLMGVKNISDKEPTDLGVEIIETKESGSRKLKIPELALNPYIDLVKKSLNLGFWNEILGETEIIFIFKFKDGSIRELKLTERTNDEIAKLCTEFNNDPLEKTHNVYKYISENDFYTDFMKQHYNDYVERN